VNRAKVTDEHIHIASNNITALGKLFVDDAYDSNDIFRCLADNGILPRIKVRKNSKVRLKTGHS
jgi:hypothetical protein